MTKSTEDIGSVTLRQWISARPAARAVAGAIVGSASMAALSVGLYMAIKERTFLDYMGELSALSGVVGGVIGLKYPAIASEEGSSSYMEQTPNYCKPVDLDV
jgi:hypothetical protein